jgi:hypothetical protein
MRPWRRGHRPDNRQRPGGTSDEHHYTTDRTPHKHQHASNSTSYDNHHSANRPAYQQWTVTSSTGYLDNLCDRDELDAAASPYPHHDQDHRNSEHLGYGNLYCS